MTSETNPNKLSSKATPGPWKVYKFLSRIDSFVIFAEDSRLAIVESATIADKRQVEANAYIISAAPEAIEFIADLVFALSNDGRYIFEPHEWVKKGEIILKKAYNL